jgi:hypothetical protein
MKTATALLLTASSVSGFAILPLNGATSTTSTSSSTALNGLFDGVKEAFSAPALERSKIDSERETPIDRWMGWSVASQNEPQVSAAQQQAAAGMQIHSFIRTTLIDSLIDRFIHSLSDKALWVCTVSILSHHTPFFIHVSLLPPTYLPTTSDFVDSMDEANYIAVALAKPMGIIFEENDSEYGGIFVQSLKEGGNAAKYGILKSGGGDQLVCVGNKNVSALDFDDALGAILDSSDEETKLTLFRGTAKQFYGPTGPSQEWLAKFCEKTGVEVTRASSSSSSSSASS